jgi:hypothetical protein
MAALYSGSNLSSSEVELVLTGFIFDQDVPGKNCNHESTGNTPLKISTLNRQGEARMENHPQVLGYVTFFDTTKCCLQHLFSLFRSVDILGM